MTKKRDEHPVDPAVPKPAPAGGPESLGGGLVRGEVAGCPTGLSNLEQPPETEGGSESEPLVPTPLIVKPSPRQDEPSP